MKHLPIKVMMSEKHHLLPEHIADFAVMQSDHCDNEATRLIIDLINKCIDDNTDKQ